MTSELSFGELAHIASDWIWESDAEHRLSFLPERAADLTGVPRADGLGTRRDEASANPDDEAFWRPHREDLSARRSFRDFVYSRRAPDGGLRWLRVSGIPLFAPDGTFRGYRGVGTDVTREKAREDALVRALADAERDRRALEEQIGRFDATVENMAEGVVMLDAVLDLIVCNRRYLEIMGLSDDVVRPGVSLRAIIAHAVARGRNPARTAEDLYAERLALFARREPAALLTEMAGGRVVRTTYRPMAGGGWVATYQDITDSVAAETALREQNRRFDAALNHMSQGLCMFDQDMRILVCNQRYLDIYGLDPFLVRPGTTLRELMEHSVALGNHAGITGEALYLGYREQLLRDGSMRVHRELADGRTIAISHGPMPGGGWVATYEDVTERRRAEARIAHMARHDALTELPNRVLLRERLEEALDGTAGAGGAFAVHCLDLDQFKAVNDTLGHPVGDALLRLVARRLRDAVPDGAVLARLGGDEFAVIQPLDPDLSAAALAHRVIEAVSAPYDLDGHHVVIGTSVGVALAPADATDADALLKHADLALYQAKADGRGVCRFFEAGMDARLLARRALELDLRAAIAREEFELWYQPQVEAATGRVQGFEALLRWRHPTRGIVPPDAFIPLAEEIGLIVPIGEWVIREACRTAAAWPGAPRVAVNISPAQFASRTLELAVVSALGRSGLSPRRLELEITETVLLADTEAALATLHRLRALGVRISMDDFGTGYSSLSYLRAFPFDKIKIDRSFVRDLVGRPDCAAIVEAVAGLGARLGMVTTAEGVETPEQLDLVRAKGCTEVQGFLVSRPLRSDALAAFLDPLVEASPAVRSA